MDGRLQVGLGPRAGAAEARGYMGQEAHHYKQHRRFNDMLLAEGFELLHTGVTVLLAEQNMHFATQISDRAYVIEKGHIRYQGTMGELVANEEVKAKYLMI